MIGPSERSRKSKLSSSERVLTNQVHRVDNLWTTPWNHSSVKMFLIVECSGMILNLALALTATVILSEHQIRLGRPSPTAPHICGRRQRPRQASSGDTASLRSQKEGSA